MKKMILATSLAILLCANLDQAVADDFKDGTVAFQSGDYKTAEALFRKAADQGNAAAQFNLGVMYKKGRGVTQDYQEAFSWWHKAAEQGVAEAQYNLGVMYEHGLGVAQD